MSMSGLLIVSGNAYDSGIKLGLEGKSEGEGVQRKGTRLSFFCWDR